MFINKLDFLSPPITLYFKGKNAHSSIFSGILSIIAYSVVIAFGIFYGLDFINRENPTAYFFNRYIENAGEFPINASAIFSFVQMMDSEELVPKDTDFDCIRIIALDRITIDNYMENNDLEHYNHWLYGNCNNDSDTVGIGHLVTQDKFEQSACIRKYYDMNRKKYFDVGDPNFVWPIIHHGMSHPDANMYGVIIEKCRNDTLRALSGSRVCRDQEYIEEYVYSSYVRFMLIDNYADVLNFKEPLTKYLYAVTNGVFPGTFTTNHLNFNPVLIKTDDGMFFEHIKEETSYFFSFNEKITSTQDLLLTDSRGKPILDENGNEVKKHTGIIIAFYFWMQNRLQFYQRNYKKFQDVLGDIGGLSSIVLTIATGINLLFTDFIVLLDTEELFLSLENKNYSSSESKRKPTIFRKAHEIMYPPKRISYNSDGNKENDSQNHQKSSNILRLKNSDVESINNNEVQNEKNSCYSNQIKDYNNLYNLNRKKYKRNQSKVENNRIKRKIISRKDNNFTYIRNKQNKISNIPNEKQNFNWFNYIKHMILFCKNDPKISYYEDFRTKLISEENIIQNYIDIYNLLEVK